MESVKAAPISVGWASWNTHVMVDAHVDILTTVLFLLDEARSETSTPRIDDGTTLLPLDRRMETEVFTACQTETSEFLLVAELLSPVLHESLELKQSLLDLGHCSWGQRLRD